MVPKFPQELQRAVLVPAGGPLLMVALLGELTGLLGASSTGLSEQWVGSGLQNKDIWCSLMRMPCAYYSPNYWQASVPGAQWITCLNLWKINLSPFTVESEAVVVHMLWKSVWFQFQYKGMIDQKDVKNVLYVEMWNSSAQLAVQADTALATCTHSKESTLV